MKDDQIRQAVREGYGKVAKSGCSCCGSASTGPRITKRADYTAEELGAVPEGADLGLGCGNPVAIAGLKEGETVLDLGSGPGLDCFLASPRVGPSGRVIGVDMTPEMLEKARENARQGGYKNVEFRLGEIEHLPVADNTVDIIISNCVINLVPDKVVAFKEAFRVLKPGGRLMLSDIVLIKELPEFIKQSTEAYVGCIAGAVMKEEYTGAMTKAGFSEVNILDETPFPVECKPDGANAEEVVGLISSIKVRGIKPGS